MPRPAKKHTSFRIPEPLEKFLREQGGKHARGFAGILEDCLTLGAIAHGYQPPEESNAFTAFADTISQMVVRKFEEKGVFLKAKDD